MRIALLAATVAFALPPLALAAEPGAPPDPGPAPPGRFYAAVKGAALLPQHVDVASFDTGSAFEVAAGWRPKESFALELGLGRSAFSESESDGALRSTVDVVAYPVSLTAKFLTSAGPATFYSMLGIAKARLSIDWRVKVSGGSSSEQSASGMATSFHFGGGGFVAVSRRVALGAELRYVIGDTKEVSREMGFHIDHLTLGGQVLLAF